ncbi:MAG TPA: TetR/AcrR family transcriptional regulator [Gaiellaceae bacterium]|jgi:TetR/AcrR family transcriptional repressor of nem operon|nr:TetR/AcrR family transcriptional regulator [Gaiellaceae bacterium]
MPNAQARARSKRQQLVESAQNLIYEQGVHRTTLAEVAERADVPVGNVYYYFKTKDDLVDAVLESRAAQIHETLEGFAKKRTPQARLKALAHGWVDVAETVAQFGCPLGTLSSELGKSPVATPDGSLFEPIVDWIETQLRELGRRDARDLAFELLARIQGGALLGQSFREPDILVRQTRRTDRWIDSL